MLGLNKTGASASLESDVASSSFVCVFVIPTPPFRTALTRGCWSAAIGAQRGA